MIPLPRQGGAGLRFRLFGFPVSIHWSFLLIAAILGLGSPGVSLGLVVLFTVVVLVSVLVHELGHAFAARGFGAAPTIDLYIFGGITAFVPPRHMGRVGSIWVTLAGPLAGFALGGFVLSVAGAFGVTEPSLRVYQDSSLAEQTVSLAIYVNIVWGFVNLLPIMPLDGGNIVRNLLPGSPEQRARTAAIASIVLSIGLVVWLFQADLGGMSTLPFLPLMLAAVNAQTLLADRGTAAAGPTEELLVALRALDDGDDAAFDRVAQLLPLAPPEARDRAKVTAIEILLRRGRGAAARRALTALPGSAHPSAYALVETVDGAPGHGVAMLDDLFARAPSATLARSLLLGRVLAGRSAEVPTVHASLVPYLGPTVFDVLRELQHVAHVRGDFRGAVLIGEHLLAGGGPVDPWVLYNLACSAACGGDPERALARLSQAIDAGWNDVHQLDTDHDLAPLWVRPEFRHLRARLAAAVPTP